jgi:hypothetical protein
MDERLAARQKAAQEAPLRSKELQDRIDARDRAQKERDAKALEQAENRRVFEAKQLEVQKRKQESEQQRQARKRSGSELGAKPSERSSDKPAVSPSPSPKQP